MLFKNQQHQASFEQDGYVLLDDFYTPEEIGQLNLRLENFDQYTEAKVKGSGDTINSVEKGIFFTRHFIDLQLEEKIRAELAYAANKALQKFLRTEYKSVAALGILKLPDSPNSEVPMHVHHSNLAPGNLLPGLSMFAPLTDISDALGPMAFIKGSQELWRKNLSYSLTYMRESYPDLYPLMRSYLTTVAPKAGQAIVFDQFTIHEGLPNTHASLSRLAMTAEFIPTEDQCVLFLPTWGKDGKVESLSGKKVLQLPFEFSKKHRWVPEHLGDEVMKVDNYQPLEITKDKFLQSCRK